jgi:hypothetical protein
VSLGVSGGNVKRAFLLLLLLAATAAVTSTFHGCATTTKKAYYNPRKTREETGKDLQECNYEATRYGYAQTGVMGVMGGERGVEQPMRNEEIMDRCMAARGYIIE